MAAVVALECVDRAGEIGEALQVFAVLEVVTAHCGREAQHFRALIGAEQRDDLVQAIDHIFEHFTAAIETVLSGIDQDAGFDQAIAQGRIGCDRRRLSFGLHQHGRFGRHVHF
ncbi:hypothetical protein AWB67_06749 [Caballeronia terrestris]|uniref:Uncharacterized protein n=1 Tax=Caballeronia terrestris TaxID=1226301 RepID=A0A158KVR5_9BURK|nr:hypothetical protein AWB67_06749 [Caballeronia terrestris]